MGLYDDWKTAYPDADEKESANVEFVLKQLDSKANSNKITSLTLLTITQLNNIATIGSNEFLPFKLENVTFNGLAAVYAHGIWIKSGSDDRHTQEVFVYQVNNSKVLRKFIRGRSSAVAWSNWIEEYPAGVALWQP